jgi:hypothetical protein
MNDDDIRDMFTFHDSDEEQWERLRALRAAGRELALLINKLCPDSEEKKLAVYRLAESITWSINAIARQGTPDTGK